NIWFGFGEGTELNAGENGIIQATGDAEDATAQFLIDHLVNNNNTLEDPALGGISRTEDGGLDPRPSSQAAFADLAATPDTDFYATPSFKGAFCADGVWIAGWTALAEYGVLNSDVPFAGMECGIVSVEDFASEANGFLLEQNTPNPIVETTNIAFTLPTTTNVSLVVYDMNGKIVKQLLNNTKLVAGQHNVALDATDLPNGTYVYSLFNANVTLGRVMVINK
ncbi:MAG: T9SS type A sorting domain-containing protein, partial [Bacteroidota bacterium]